MATMDAENRVNAVASEKGEDTMPMVAPGSGVAQQSKAMQVDSSNSKAAGQSANKPTTPEPSEKTVRRPEQESEAAVGSSAPRKPYPPQHQGTGISRAASQEAAGTDGVIAQGLTDETTKKATASGKTPTKSRPAAKIADKKEYCSYWIRKGECDYTQSGCKYKHEVPVDEETRQRIGIREIPRWFMDSPGYEEYLQKTEELAIGRLAGVSAEGKGTSTAESSRQGSGRRGESVVRLQGAGRTPMTPTTRRDAMQLGSHRVRSPYDNYHQSIVTPQPDAKSARAGPPSAANTNATDGAAVRQLEGQIYKPPGATASSSGFNIRGAAGESSKVKDGNFEKPPMSQAKSNGESGIPAGSPHFRQFQQALLGSRSAGDSAGSMMGGRTRNQFSSPVPDTDDQRARRGGKGAKMGRNEG